MVEPLFLEPVFHEKIWGGRRLEKDFGYHLPDGKIGECWAISGHPHGTNQVKNGPYAGQKLSDLYVNEPQLFDHPQMKRFPLLIKILDAEASLSIQVHPDDQYAEEHENDLGKTECWYVIHAEPVAYLIYGHHAQTKEQLSQWVNEGKWDKLLRKQPVKTGDFVFVPHGTIHALTKGIEVLETQQSSDVTYRLYDYDRVDQKTGKKRALHTEQSLDVIQVPFKPLKLTQKVEQMEQAVHTTLVAPPISPYFTVYKDEINGQAHYTLGKRPYLLYSVINGQGTLKIDQHEYSIKKGDHFIIPYGSQSWSFNGKLLLISSCPSLDKY